MHGIAIIGTGGIGKTHAAAFIKDSRCSVKALCSRTISKCYDLIAELGLGDDVSVTDDWHTLLGRSDIDIVSIALPPALHEEATSAFLRAGKHVLLEKPMGIAADEDDRMIEASRESGSP